MYVNKRQGRIVFINEMFVEFIREYATVVYLRVARISFNVHPSPLDKTQNPTIPMNDPPSELLIL